MVLVAASCGVVQHAGQEPRRARMVQPRPVRRVRLADRIAAWFGYVRRPVPSLMYSEELRRYLDDCATRAELNRTPTQTTVNPRPEIILSTRVNKGIPCS